MQEVMVTRTIVTPQLATAASMLVRLAQPADQSLHRALQRAEERLVSQPWRVDEGILTIVSFSRQNETHKTDGEFCECEAKRGVCWHRAAHAILSTLAAAGCEPVASLPLPTVVDEDELPASFLDGDLSAFDDVELTMPFDELPPATPFHVQPARVMTVDARSQALADELFA